MPGASCTALYPIGSFMHGPIPYWELHAWPSTLLEASCTALYPIGSFMHGPIPYWELHAWPSTLLEASCTALYPIGSFMHGPIPYWELHAWPYTLLGASCMALYPIGSFMHGPIPYIISPFNPNLGITKVTLNVGGMTIHPAFTCPCTPTLPFKLSSFNPSPLTLI